MTDSKKNIKIVYDYILENSNLDELKDALSNHKTVGVSAYDIEISLGIKRNNASTLLNALNADFKLVKIKGKPVRFIAMITLELLLETPNIKNAYNFKALVDQWNQSSQKQDPFETLIGNQESLSAPIDQAKAAIIYPPNGLHTLLLGPSGVGKTLFAKCMHSFALQEKNKTIDEMPFIHFNCSDYYNNPQLLLSQLFGHVKGAFTGAEMNKDGLVSNANGGVLFLDEIHRLSSDGQEMLFSLMDKGEYSRLGDPTKKLKSDVFIIAATTETPNEVLLRTFLRRVPVSIHLPSLQNKAIEERLEIIEFLFKAESIRINRDIVIHNEVVRALLLYECIGNIGQLKSDIKLICAKSYLKKSNEEDNLYIEYQYLPNFIKDQRYYFSDDSTASQEFIKNIGELKVTVETVTFKRQEKFIYNQLNETLFKLNEQGFSQEEIHDRMRAEIQIYYKNVVNDFNYQKYNIREFYKMIDKDIVDLTLKLVQYAADSLKIDFNDNLLFGLSFHIKALINRINEGEAIVNEQLLKTKSKYPEVYSIAEEMVSMIMAHYNIEIPQDEVGFITIILMNNMINPSEKKIGLLIISHGMSTATSMANVCNRLLNSNYVKAIDMPLEVSTKVIYEKAEAIIKGIDQGKGVLILVDMGSLSSIGEKVTNRTGILTKTIENVSTPMVLNVVRMMLNKDISVDEIHSTYQMKSKTSVEDKKVQFAILCVCATGQGASVIIEKKIEEIIEKSGKPVDVIAMSFDDINQKTKAFTDVESQYQILACVGTLQPETNYPYVTFNELFGDHGELLLTQYTDTVAQTTATKSVYEQSEEILQQYVLYINPKIAVKYIGQFIKALINDGLHIEDDVIVKLTTHICCMLERNIIDQHVKFDQIGDIIRMNQAIYTLIKKHIMILEKTYKLEISDDEIGFMIQVITH